MAKILLTVTALRPLPQNTFSKAEPMLLLPAIIVSASRVSCFRPQWSDFVIRPANFPDDVVGKGYTILDHGRYSVCVINLMGVVFMQNLENPFHCIDRILSEVKSKVIIVDFHAEATSEKRALGHYLTGRVSAVLGTHTHVQTADEEILGGHTGYITDVGMTGVTDSVLGIKKEIIISNMMTGYPQRYEYADGDYFICGVVVSVDEKSGICTSIKRIRY